MLPSSFPVTCTDFIPFQLQQRTCDWQVPPALAGGGVLVHPKPPGSHDNESLVLPSPSPLPTLASIPGSRLCCEKSLFRSALLFGTLSYLPEQDWKS